MFGLVLVELVTLGGHWVLATEPVAAELERLGQARRLDAAPDLSRPPMRSPPSKALGGSLANIRCYFGE
jgi:hypothetical protein